MNDTARGQIVGLPGLDQNEEEIGRLASALGDPTRRKVFFAVRNDNGWMSKDEVAEAVGIDRRLAGHHLDKLVEHGFLEADFHRRSGRTGPGAGRPAKLYRFPHGPQATVLPERHYDLLASLLLEASAAKASESTEDALERVGYAFGYRVGMAEVEEGRTRPGQAGVDAVGEVVRLLSRFGFAAQEDGPGLIRACSCPFEELAKADPERVCGLDRAIWRGMLAAFDSSATLSVENNRALGANACMAEVAAVSPSDTTPERPE